MLAIAAVCLALTACRASTQHRTSASPPPKQTGETAPQQAQWITLAQGLRLNRAPRTVEFDATIAIDAHNPRSPEVYLELIACAPDTREHESLVVTTVRPSLIHAALLAIDATPGKPGQLATDTKPRGDPILVTIINPDGTTADPREWITDAPTHQRRPAAGFVFAGSRQARPNATIAYDADGTGVIIGLTTFGSEVIAHLELINPAADIDEPIWIANPAAVPPANTPVRVRLTPQSTTTPAEPMPISNPE